MLTRKKSATVATMSVTSTTVSINANAPWCQAKKSHDQSAFTASWSRKTASAAFARTGARQTSHAAMPISA